MTKRTDIINSLIKKYNYKSYLEIGIKNPRKNFDLILIKNKDGVDPVWKLDPLVGNKFEVDSDNFFAELERDKKYDIIFIDGLHYNKQIDKDIINSLKHLKDDGIIMLHDCNPTKKFMQDIPRRSSQWTGDGWKSVFKLRCLRSDLNVFVVNCDFGCGVIRKGKQELYNIDDDIQNYLNWDYFDKNRKKILNLISVEEYKKWAEN